jgi:aminoglycoside phosphotransferase (APT) family kinase protein
MDEELAPRLLRTIRSLTATPTLAYMAPPERLTGGFWAELLAFRLADAPDGLTGDLVARVMPDPVMARKETVIQSAVAEQGFPTPTVRLSGGPDAGLGRAFMVMDRINGAALLAGLDGVGAITELPRLFARIPRVLAATMADLHRLDPASVGARLGDGGDVPTTVPALLERLRALAEMHGRRDLVQAADWLTAHPPPPSREVICHGDLHPFNLLVDESGGVTVLDWSAGLLGPMDYDVAFTSLMLAEPPIAVPGAARPLVRAAGRLLSRRFLRQYQDRSGATIDKRSLHWHQSLVCLRALVEVASWASAGELDAKAGHPWLVCGPAFVSRVGKLTAVRVRAR